MTLVNPQAMWSVCPAVTKGCPDPDSDADGVPDRVDNCPSEAGLRVNMGCLKPQLVEIHYDHLAISKKVYFGTAKSKILGRDHYPDAFTMWMAGGGVRPGITYGETDEFCYNLVDREQTGVHVHDLNATILHQLGIDHARLSFPFQGLDQRLTGVEPARVVRDILV